MTSERDPEKIDWSLTTWEGSRRWQMRRWAEQSLEEIILDIEELEALSTALAPADGGRTLQEMEQFRKERAARK